MSVHGPGGKILIAYSIGIIRVGKKCAGKPPGKVVNVELDENASESNAASGTDLSISLYGLSYSYVLE